MLLPDHAFGLAAFVLINLIPGYALIEIFWPRASSLSPAERFGLAAGVGVAIPPLLIYLADLAGLRWGRAATWLYAIGAALIVVAAIIMQGRARRTQSLGRQRADRVFFGLLILTLMAAWVRLHAVRELRAGMFGDSVHHTMIAQLMLENGGLFSSWRPYAPLTTLTYHFGFHANVAFYAWLLGAPATTSVLIYGQLLNAAAVPLAFLLASRVIGAYVPDRASVAAAAGLWAAAFTGFANTMPAYFVNWGRYTQLAGQIILPALLVAWIELIERSADGSIKADRRPIALAALLTTALMLTHYIVTIFAALMVGSYLIARILQLRTARPALCTALPALGAAAAALVATWPWIQTTLAGGLLRNTSLMVSGGISAERVAGYATLTPITPFYLKGWLLALAIVGLGVAIAQRQWRPTIFAVWAGLLLFTVTPNTFGLPGNGVIDQLTAYIALYVPVAPLAGYGLAELHTWVTSRLEARLQWMAHAYLPATLAATLAIAAWGAATWLPRVVEPVRQMLTPADERAMAWIAANLPENARFVVNTFPAYGGSLIAGTDGGWWIPLMTKRATNLPPITYGSEAFEDPAFYRETNAFAAALRGAPLTDPAPRAINLATPENIQRLRAAGFTHVYKGANQTPGPAQADWIDTAALRNSDHFQLIYEAGGVEIFALVK
ncbi:MAG: hypothetical protein RMN52_14080 [Anaerolineae bacterium]|nr:DUF1616 domain-containing protein [Candidatus Roseilinea sp.]MDW8451123.1 hypothetical protein [Anaerolineae bacterium]